MATPVPPPEDGVQGRLVDVIETSGGAAGAGANVPEPLKQVADAYIKAVGNINQWIGENKSQSGRNWNRLITTVQKSAATLRAEWEKNETSNLRLESEFPNLPDIKEFADINFDDLGPAGKDTPPEILRSPDDHWEKIDPANHHAWITEKGITPIMRTGNIEFLQKLGIHVDENGKPTHGGFWVLEDNELDGEGNPPASWKPLFEPGMSGYPKHQRGQEQSKYLLPNPQLVNAEGQVMGQLVKDLVTLNLNPEDGRATLWDKRIADIL